MQDPTEKHCCDVGILGKHEVNNNNNNNNNMIYSTPGVLHTQTKKQYYLELVEQTCKMGRVRRNCPVFSAKFQRNFAVL